MSVMCSMKTGVDVVLSDLGLVLYDCVYEVLPTTFVLFCSYDLFANQ